MKIKKEPIREDRYLNMKIDTYPVDFNVLDTMFYDFTQFAYCVVMNDGEKDIFLEYANSKPDALKKHKEYYERLLLRPTQWFDVKSRKFKYVSYRDIDVEEKLTDVKTIDEKDLYSAFLREAQQIVVNGSNNGLTFYTKREATDYSRKVSFSIFSGLRVKIGQLRTTSYAELIQSDARAVDNFVKTTEEVLAKRFLTEMYDPASELHERWELFIGLVEAKIAEYFREGNRSTKEAPNYIILAELAKEIDDRIALTRKPSDGVHASDGPAHAEYERRVKENTPGKFYVDEKCIVCDACAATAPKYFKLNEQTAFLYNQPQTAEDIELCNKALAGCPVSAIGNDGDIKSASAQPAVESAPVNIANPVPSTTHENQPNPIDPNNNQLVPGAIPVDRTTDNTVNNINKVDNSETIVDKDVDINEMKTLLESIPMDKLAEIKALLRSSAVIQETSQPVPEVQEPVAQAVVAEEAPVAGGPKPLPAQSPDGSAIYPDNVPGMFYVDDKCIECDACVGAAPNSFVIEDGHAFVFAQPLNDKEIEECKEAMAGCPVNAININD